MEHTTAFNPDRTFSKEFDGVDKPDIGGLFSAIKPLLLFVIIVAVYMLIITLGAFIGHQKLLNGIKEPETAIETTVASVLGLLAFILGFTFSLTWTRFANRNRMVIEHAKAIGVCYLRTGLITQSQKVQVRKYLYDYTTLLLEIQTGKQVENSIRRIDELHMLIWKEAESLVREEIDSEMRSLFVTSVNDLISLSLERKTITLFIKVPNAIWRTLLLLAAIGMLGFGYQAGIFGISKLFQLLLLPIAFGLVIVLISELNSNEPKRRRFRVIRRPLKEVLDMMKEEKLGRVVELG
jgi:hypothetical protein